MDSMAVPGAPLAAIDLGSNSLRLEIAQVVRGEYRRIEYLKETVRLGAGLKDDGSLSEAAMQRALGSLARFGARLADFKPNQVRAVATQTLRDASNREAFLERGSQALGFPIEVVSGREEARLTYSGVARLQAEADEEPRLVVDVGGRSTELILGVGRKPLEAESFAVGCVSLGVKYFPEGRITEAGFRAAQIAAGAQLEEGLQTFSRRQGRWRQALGSSGASSALAKVLAAVGVTDGSITPEALRWAIRQCLACGHVQAIDLPTLTPERRALMPGGLAILYTLAMQFDIANLQAVPGALRQGVIFDLAERRQAWRSKRLADARDDSVARLQQRFAVDVRQASRVAGVALALFDALRPAAEAQARRELQWAAHLHECGLSISHHNHHRHSAYLLAHVDAPGFSQSQQKRLADLVLAQRGSLRKVQAPLGADDNFAAQALCLRLAVIQCHARARSAPAAWRLRQRIGHATLACPPEWAAHNPRTMHLLQEECEQWSRSGPMPLQLGQARSLAVAPALD